jgi:hypothetical protein
MTQVGERKGGPILSSGLVCTMSNEPDQQFKVWDKICLANFVMFSNVVFRFLVFWKFKNKRMAQLRKIRKITMG